jgi:hypothetical protein
MTVVNNAELWFARLDPKYPNDKFNKDNPTWEVQIRTKDRKVAKLWKDEYSLKTTQELDADDKPYWKSNLKRRSKKANGEALSPVEVVDGDLNPVDPRTIGNGSIGNVSLFQYESKSEAAKGKIISMLKKIQLTKHIVYDPPKKDEFAKTKTEVVKAEGSEGTESTGTSFDDMDDDIPF